MNKLNLKDLMLELSYKDLRAVRNWCKKNGVLIIITGKAEFVFEANYREAIEKTFINKLKAEFGKGWESAYQLYANGNIAALITLQTLPEITLKTYKPQDNLVKSYQEKFNQYAKK